MKNTLKLLKSKKGVTLVELMVVLFISSILLTIAFNFLQLTNGLMTSIKSNTNLDTTCDAVNEYFRSSLQNAITISVFSYPENASKDISDPNSESSKMIAQYENYFHTYYEPYKDQPKKDQPYTIRAIGVLKNWNRDYRLYDFGDISNLSELHWGTGLNYEGVNKYRFDLLIDNRDGGGRWQNGLDYNEFHRFDAFNDAFYSNAESGHEANYSFQVCFDSAGKQLTDDKGALIPDVYVDYFTLKSQIFKRTGDSYEPANQLREISFKLYNGTAEFLGTTNEDGTPKATVNKTITEGGTEMIDISDGMCGAVMLYVTRNL